MLIEDVQNNNVMCDMQRRSTRQFGLWRRGWFIPWLVRGCFAHPSAIWGLSQRLTSRTVLAALPPSRRQSRKRSAAAIAAVVSAPAAGGATLAFGSIWGIQEER